MKMILNEQETELQKQVTHLGIKQRLKYALNGVGLYFLIALGTVLIPILHFILVPFFLGVSMYSGFSRFQKTKSIDLTGVTCPNCLVDLKMELVYFNTDELHLTCEKCHTAFTLR